MISGIGHQTQRIIGSRAPEVGAVNKRPSILRKLRNNHVYITRKNRLIGAQGGWVTRIKGDTTQINTLCSIVGSGKTPVAGI